MVLVFCTLSHGGKHFCKVSWKYLETVFKLRGGHDFMTKISIYNVQRAITSNVGKPQLWFLHSACCLMVVNICVKFSKNISNCFQVQERTPFCDRPTDVHGKINMCPDPERRRHNKKNCFKSLLIFEFSMIKTYTRDTWQIFNVFYKTDNFFFLFALLYMKDL